MNTFSIKTVGDTVTVGDYFSNSGESIGLQVIDVIVKYEGML
jgi:hypothetical protein